MKLVCCLAAGLLFCSIAAASAQSYLLESFDSQGDLWNVSGSGATWSLTSSLGVTEGASALEAQFQPNVQWPFIDLDYAGGSNFSSYAGFQVDITNPTSSSELCNLSFYSAQGSQAINHSFGNNATIPANSTVSVYIPFVPDLNPATYGMEKLPSNTPYPKIELTYNPSSSFNLSAVYDVKLGIALTSGTGQILVFDNVRLIDKPTASTLSGIIGAYGTYTGATWPNKLSSDAALQTEGISEAVTLAISPPPVAAQDKWGGWSAGPQLTATGFFRTTNYNGNWWFVDPDGRLFFTVGINTTSDSTEHNDTFIAGRSRMFLNLPVEPNADCQFFGISSDVFSGPISSGETFDFYDSNLYRKFGNNWQSDWQNETLARFKAWGINTIAAWSDSSLTTLSLMPYEDSESITGSFNTINTGQDIWTPMADPFDSRFASAAQVCVAALVGRTKTNPWCIGFFIDNELSWNNLNTKYGKYALSSSTLEQNTSYSPAKQAFLSQLETKYGTIASLNSAWATSFSDWTSMDAPITIPSTPNAAMLSDMSAFLLSFAQKYFSAVHSALKAQDPNHLYLGCRIGTPAWGTHTPADLPAEVIQAAGQYCDAVSFNYYGQSVVASQWPFLNGLGKPALISEFSSGATDTGKFYAGQLNVNSQAGRAAQYSQFVSSVISNPEFIGCQWYQYVDDPTTGTTFNGENANVGLVDVEDTPYSDLIEALEETNGTIYSARTNP